MTELILSPAFLHDILFVFPWERDEIPVESDVISKDVLPHILKPHLIKVEYVKEICLVLLEI